ncbi:MAG: LLM class flavin-dependent oxidoreductase [Actinobacteria bacterium]|nr:LLM class flavin-dependent oxidoreductase [Actinomycetota bacterium]
MKFSLYSELQSWPGKTAAELYGEVMEQVVNADRLGYDAYAVIEHFFFPKFSISANPLALFAACAQRTRRIVFRTLLHSMPYHNPLVLASEIAVADILLEGRYEFGVGRGHGWMPPKAGLALTPESRERYEESIELLFTALENERFSYAGKHFQIADSGIVPRPDRKFRVFLGGTSDRTYELAAERGWAVVVPPLLPYAALKDQLDLYRAKCAEHGTEPDIVWIHACYIDEDRAVAKREAKQWTEGFLRGNASPLTDFAPPPTDELNAAGYGFYAAGILEKLADTPYDEMIAGDIVWVGTPQDVIERIEAVQEVCEGLTEISITVNAGGAEHWQAIKAQELFARSVIPHFQTHAQARVTEKAATPA